VRDPQTLVTSEGYLAPFAYFKLFVIDVASGDVITDRAVTTAKAYMADPKVTFDHWQAVPDSRKAEVLLEMIQAQIRNQLTARALGF
jgi:hypothetical protein